MKREINPVVMWVSIGLVVVVVAVLGFKMLSGGYAKDTKGSESTIQQVKQTGKFYDPKIPGGAPGLNGQPGYNLNPPSH